MKIVALGTSEFLACCVRGFVRSGEHQIVEIIALSAAVSPDNSVDLTPVCRELSITYKEVEDINSPVVKSHLRSLAPDIIFSAWPRILDAEVLTIPTLGVIGSHPTALPFNRGRHPLHWQIVLGLTASKLSFFWMNEGVDSGPVILQTSYAIDPQDTIVSLNQRVNDLGYLGCSVLSALFLEESISSAQPQNRKHANVWRKRDRHDVLIDFRMNGDAILALVRSFTEPYPCASFLFEKNYFQVISGEKINLDTSVPIQYFEPGYVLQLSDQTLCVKVADSVLRLKLKQNMESFINGACKYIHPATRYLAKYPELACLFT